MEFAQIKFVTCPELPDGEAFVMSAKRVAEVRKAMSDRMDAMLLGMIGAPLLPQPSVFHWPPKPAPNDPYGIIAIRNVA